MVYFGRWSTWEVRISLQWIVWDSNKAIDIREWPICGSGRLVEFYCTKCSSNKPKAWHRKKVMTGQVEMARPCFIAGNGICYGAALPIRLRLRHHWRSVLQGSLRQCDV